MASGRDRSALPAHGEDCTCTRCVGFEPGNTVAVTHGAYVSPVRLSERAQEIADLIRPTLPVGGPQVEPVLASYAIVLVRIERASAAMDAVEEAADEAGARPAGLYLGKAAEPLARLRADLRSWIGLSLKLAAELGLTPAGAARLMRDAGAGRASAAQAALREHITANYGELEA